MLALSGPEEALQWLLSQPLRYSFCGICGNELEGLALITQGQKSFFPHWPVLHHFFYYHLYWCGDAQKDHNGFYVCNSLTVVKNILRVLHRHCWRRMLSLTVLAWEAFQKVTLIAPQVASEASKVLMVRHWTLALGCHQVYPWCTSTRPWW